MRVFDNKKVNVLYFLYRMVSPIVDPIRFYLGITGYFWFIRDIILYKKKDPSAKIISINLFPILNEKVSYTPFDGHYFYQQLWAYERILKKKPKIHADIGSTYSMSGYISKITKAIFVDLRPIKTSLKNLEVLRGDILALPFKTSFLSSLSCLHVAEHIGLGRYGDPIDPYGTKKACKELSRVLARGGSLYFSVPIGKERLCFNGHRIHDPYTILRYFKDLKLTEFSVVDDKGDYFENVDYKNYKNLHYGCGMFLFKKN